MTVFHFFNKYQLSLTNPRGAASRQKRSKQRRTLGVGVINERPNSVDSACNGQRFRVIASYLSHLSKVANFNLPHLHLASPLRVTPFEFCQHLQRQKTRLTWLSCSVICVILRLAVSVEHRLVTETDTTTAYTALALRRAVKNQ